MLRLAIITSHPIQYNAPLFKKLSQVQQLELKVFYTWEKDKGPQYDPGFKKNIDWDIPLLDGYAYTFVKNTARTPGTFRFFGLVNPTLIKEISDFQPAVLLVYGWNFYSHLKAMRYFKNKVPIWFRGDSHLLDESQWFKILLRRIFLTWVYKYADKALFVGSNNKQYYLVHGLSESQLMYVPHVVDNDFFALNDSSFHEQAKAWRWRLGIQTTDMALLFAGKFEPKKNPVILLKAIIELNRNQNNRLVHAIFVGNGMLESELKRLSKNLNFIHFIPSQNQSLMPVVYRLGDIFCLPSQGPGETWGLAINEAMACGLPILASDKCGCAIDLVQNNGYVFKHNDIEDLKSKISRMNDLGIREKMGIASKKIIQRYSIDEVVTSIKEACYEFI